MMVLQCSGHILLHPLQGVQEAWQSVAAVVLLVQLSGVHRQHILVVQVVELGCSLVVALACTLRLFA